MQGCRLLFQSGCAESPLGALEVCDFLGGGRRRRFKDKQWFVQTGNEGGPPNDPWPKWDTRPDIISDSLTRQTSPICFGIMNQSQIVYHSVYDFTTDITNLPGTLRQSHL